MKNNILLSIGFFLLLTSITTLRFVLFYESEINHFIASKYVNTKKYSLSKEKQLEEKPLEEKFEFTFIGVSGEDSILEEVNLCIKENTISEMIDSHISENIQKELNKYLLQLPENIHTLLKTSNWKIYTTKDNLGDLYFNGTIDNVSGVTIWSKKEIHLYENTIAFEKSVLHELGHAVDCELSINEDEIWKSIYIEEKEKAIFMEDYGKSNIKEYFADSFLHYITNQEELKKICPKTYQYIDEIISIL